MIDYDADGLKYEALEKGDYISIDVLRKITGLDPYENIDLYRIAVLKIRGRILDKCDFFVRCEGFALRILKDAEAVYYKTRRFEQGWRAQKRAYERGLKIDESQLDTETREAFRKSNNYQSRLLSAGQAEYKRIRSEARKEERPPGPLEKEIKIFSTGKDKTEDGNSTTEDQVERGGGSDSAQRMVGESAGQILPRNQGDHKQEE